MKVLVVGGAGYIGSHMVKNLLRDGHEVVVVDNFSTGHSEAILDVELVKMNIGDAKSLKNLFNKHNFNAVMHFASFINVGESVVDPSKYYYNNFNATLTLLQAILEENINYFIFSSSAAVYGIPEYVPIDEEHPKEPINPYGRTKWMVEQMLRDFECAYGLKSICLRYFNAAGADPEGELGERHVPETHLIPLILQAASGRREGITVYGHDYNTPDGTCIRDYIHVVDLVEAHALALNYLMKGGTSTSFNLGNGNGFSVKEVIDTACRVTNREIKVFHADRRPGDPPRLVADASLARKVLDWRPKKSSLENIIGDAWAWEQLIV